MTPTSDAPDDSLTQADFERELDHLVATARDSDVSVEGAYNVRSPRPASPDYTIEITEITSRMPDWLHTKP